MFREKAYAVVMAGGVGSRFWPMSRSTFPKQFHDVLGVGRTLLQMTCDRFEGLVPPERIFIVTNAAYGELAREQLPELPAENILLEPVGRNTAPCILYAASRIAKVAEDALLVVTPADHMIGEPERFRAQIGLALDAAGTADRIITLGVRPTRPDTGFGYIQYHKEPDKNRVHKVKVFTEKPSLELARRFIESGDFVWNSGIFVFSARTIRREFFKRLPEMHELFEDVAPILGSEGEAEKIAAIYPECKNISIDYGVLEKADNVYVIPADFSWNDLGTWTSLYEQMHKDYLRNALTGNVRIYNASNNIVKIYADKLAVVKGVTDLIIVDTDDVLLVCPKDQEQTIREVVNDLKKEKNDGARYT